MDFQERLDLDLKTRLKEAVHEHHPDQHRRQPGPGHWGQSRSREALVHADERVIPVILDVTDSAQIQQAAESIDSLDMTQTFLPSRNFPPLTCGPG